VTYRSASTSIFSGVVRRPARVAKGDLLVAALEVDADPVRVQAPAGWTLIQDTPVARGTDEAFHALVYTKVATASEPATYTFRATPNTWIDAQILAYSGVDTSRPIDAVAGRDAGSGRLAQTPSLTTTTARDRLVLVFISFDFGTWTGSSGLTERTDFDANAAYDQSLGAPGATGSRSAIASSRGAMAAIAIALRPR
jgi:hypothetical protein